MGDIFFSNQRKGERAAAQQSGSSLAPILPAQRVTSLVRERTKKNRYRGAATMVELGGKILVEIPHTTPLDVDCVLL